MENCFKVQPLDPFADRTSAIKRRAKPVGLWFSLLAYVLTSALRRLALAGILPAQQATGSTVRLPLLKLAP
jgi:hypothetical protein